MTEGTENGQEVAKIAHPKLAHIEQFFVTIRPDLEGDQFWRYQRAISPGLQEYIEALSFAHFLTYDSLITWKEVQDHLSDESGSPVRFLPCVSCLTRCIHTSRVLSYQTMTDHIPIGLDSTFLCQSKTTCLACPILWAS